MTQAIKRNPNDADAYYNRGEAYYEKGNHGRSIFYEEIELDPDPIYRNDYNRAIADYTKAIELNPNNADAYHIRGQAYSAKGGHARASVDFTKAKHLRNAPPHLYLFDAASDSSLEKLDFTKLSP